MLNAANEAAVNLFLSDRIPFGAIARVVEETLAEADNEEPNEESIFGNDEWARRKAVDLAEKYIK